MALPTIRKPTVAPSRKMARDVYPIVADEWAASIGPFTDDLIAAITWMGNQVTDVASFRDQAAASAKAAAQSVSDAAAQVKLATDQAVASKGSADSAAASLASVKVVAQAVDASAGLPPTNLPGGVLRQKPDGSGAKEWWLPILSQVGDTIISTQAPNTDWVPTGSVYPQSLYPNLFAKLGKIPDFRDDQFQTFGYPGGSTIGVGDWAYGNGVLFGMGIPASINTFSIFYSRDLGATWAVLGKAANYYVNQIAFGNNVFVAPDNGGSVVSVFDTTNNQSYNYNLPNQNNWAFCAFGNNTFIALGSGGATNNQARSTDNGKTWQVSTFPSDMTSPGNIVFFSAMFMVFSSNSAFPFYYTSADGLSWTKRNAPGAIAFSRRSMAVANGVLIALDSSTTYKTTNGVNWINNVGGNPFTYSNSLFAVAGGENVFMVAPGGSASGKVYFSTDGFNWAFRNKLLTPTTQAANIPIYANGSFLIHVSNASYAWRIKAFSYNNSTQFYTSDAPVNPQIGLTQYIRGA